MGSLFEAYKKMQEVNQSTGDSSMPSSGPTQDICSGCKKTMKKCGCEVNEAALSPKQKKIAKLAGNPDEIDAEDLKKLRKEDTKPPFDGPYTTTFKKAKNPNRTGMDAARALSRKFLQKSKNTPVISGHEGYSSEPDKLKPQHFGKQVKEEVLDEANHRNFASVGMMHPDMAKHMNVGDHMDYYEPKTGNKVHGKVMRKSDTEVHMKQTHDSYDPKKVGTVHKFKVSSSLPDIEMKEEVEQVQEVLTVSAGISKWIHDFVHSTNPKFKGKSVKQRQQMALGAFYAAKKGVKEDYSWIYEGEQIDEKITVVRDPSKVRTDAPQGRGDVYVPTAPVPPKKKLPMRSRVGHPTNMKEDAKSEGGLKLLATLKANPHEEATTHLNKAKAEKEGSEAYHFHMSNHHEAMGHWHNSKGRSHSADQEYDKAEAHHGAWYKKAMKEEVETLDELSIGTVKSLKKKLENLRDTYRDDAAHQSNDSDRSKLSTWAKETNKRVKAAAKKISKTNEEVEQIEEGDLTIRHLYNKFADAHVNGNDTKSTEKVIRKVHGDEVFKHMKKAANANARADFDGEDRHFDNAQTAGRKTDRLGSTVGRGRSEFRKRFEEVEIQESNHNVAATVHTQNYTWGKMKTIHQGHDFSIPLHPEHHEAIAKLEDQQEHKFKDETGRHWTAKRVGTNVHFQGANGGNSTSVSHSSMKEDREMKTFKEFITEIKLADLPVRRIQGRSYGADYEDPEGKEDSDKPAAKKAEKRGRGRPAGSKSGARQMGGASKQGSGVDYTGYKLHLPNSNKSY